VAEGEMVFAGQPYAEKDNSRGGDGGLLNGGGGGRLDYVRCGVANGAVRMCQPIRMEMRLLNAGAYEKEDGAHNGKQKISAYFGRAILCQFPHLYRILYATLVAALREPAIWNGAIDAISFGGCSPVQLDSAGGGR
jgi:hypothetical protein